jgi:aminopeptidase N
VFDQPDIKAKWTMTAVIPADWDAVSNEFIDAAVGERSHQAKVLIDSTATLFS